MESSQAQNYASRLTDVARQLKAFAKSLKAQRSSSRKRPKAVREPAAEYILHDAPFSEADLEWLETISKIRRTKWATTNASQFPS